MPTHKPKLYQKLAATFPKYIEAVESLGQAANTAGPLDEKTQQLLHIAAAAALRSEGAVHSHTRRALKAGATPTEVQHALIAVSSTIGFPQVTAALSWVDDIIEHPKSE